MDRISKVKSEIKQLRKNMRLLNALADSDVRMSRRLDMLMASPKSEAVKCEVERIQRSLNSVDARRLSGEILELEGKYMGALGKLSPIDKTIFLEFCIEGMPYWKIGMNTGYSQEGVRKRMYKMLETIAEEVYGKK